MNNTEHTPGPWYITQTGAITGASYVIVKRLVSARPDADRRLIAASPDLLTACRLILSLHDKPSCQVPGHVVNLDPQAAAQLRAAIAKARGNQ
jgi:hypothetical protein